MNQQDAEEYTQSLGQIVSGSFRQIALANRLGVPAALGFKGKDRLKNWVTECLGGYVKMEITERKQAAIELKEQDGLSNRQIAQVLGVDEGTVRNDLRAENSADEDCRDSEIKGSDDQGAENSAPLLDAIPAAQKTRSETSRNRKAELHAPSEIRLAPGLHAGDFRVLSKQIADDSVQLVFTDPPYDANSVDLYGDAARIAARILTPGGSFIAYCGHAHLPDVLAKCQRYLDYFWIISREHAGGNHRLLDRLGIRAGWMPIIWFVKGFRGDIQNIVSDFVSSSRPEKELHEWQQPEKEARYYIEKLTTPDGLVVDFCVGSGTTAAAAKQLGRQWIGFEIDPATAERASRRIEGGAP